MLPVDSEVGRAPAPAPPEGRDWWLGDWLTLPPGPGGDRAERRRPWLVPVEPGVTVGPGPAEPQA